MFLDASAKNKLFLKSRVDTSDKQFQELRHFL
jgi:hypothetical protein